MEVAGWEAAELVLVAPLLQVTCLDGLSAG